MIHPRLVAKGEVYVQKPFIAKYVSSKSDFYFLHAFSLSISKLADCAIENAYVEIGIKLMAVGSEEKIFSPRVRRSGR